MEGGFGAFAGQSEDLSPSLLLSLVPIGPKLAFSDLGDETEIGSTSRRRAMPAKLSRELGEP